MTQVRKQSLKKSRNLVSRKNNVRNRKVTKITRKQRGGQQYAPNQSPLHSEKKQGPESKYALVESPYEEGPRYVIDSNGKAVTLLEFIKRNVENALGEIFDVKKIKKNNDKNEIINIISEIILEKVETEYKNNTETNIRQKIQNSLNKFKVSLSGIDNKQWAKKLLKKRKENIFW